MYIHIYIYMYKYGNYGHMYVSGAGERYITAQSHSTGMPWGHLMRSRVLCFINDQIGQDVFDYKVHPEAACPSRCLLYFHKDVFAN